MFELTGRNALVTGASRGLGRAVALCLAKAGANVCVNYLGAQAAAEEVAASIRAMGRSAFAMRADVGDEADVRAMVEAVRERFGGLDILVCNAGTNADEGIDETSLESWERVLRCNLTGTFLCAKAFMDMLRASGRGRVIVMSSVVAEQGGLYGQTHYAASKGGQLAFVKTLARAVAKDGVTVNAIAPGTHKTELVEEILGGPSERLKATLSRIPLGRFGTAEDIGYASVFLASDEAGYVTGTTLDVNGGMYMD